jgi:3-oxoacyl-ACP reductase-like protein
MHIPKFSKRKRKKLVNKERFAFWAQGNNKKYYGKRERVYHDYWQKAKQKATENIFNDLRDTTEPNLQIFSSMLKMFPETKALMKFMMGWGI